MSAAAVVALIVAAGEAQAPATTAMLGAAREALGSGVSIEVRAMAAPPSDDGALRVEAEMSAQAVVALLWRDAARTQARVRLHVARTGRWTERDITFSTTDTLVERGRALGFAVASMLPEAEPTLQRAPPAPPPEPASSPPPPPAREPPMLVPGRVAVGLAATGSAGIGGAAGGLGGAVDGEVLAWPSLSLRAAFTARSGAVADLPGSDLALSLAAGLAWWPLPPVAERRLSAAVRVDALALYQSVTYEAAGTASERKGRLLPGADLAGSVAWRVVPRVEAVAGAGVEAAFGSTALLVHGAQVASVPPLRGVAQAGVRFRF